MIENILSYIAENLPFLNNGYIWLTQHKYIYAFFVFITFYILSEAVVLITEKIVLKFVSKTKTKLDDEIVHKVNKPLAVLLILIGLWLGFSTLDISETVTNYSNKIFVSFITLTVAYIAVSVLNTIIKFWGEKKAKKTESKVDDSLVSLSRRFFKVVGFLIAVLVILSVWGIEIGPLLASLGIAGIAVAFALQSTLGNIFGGVSLLLDRTFKVGDIIQIDSGESGVVYDVGLRATRIKTWDNQILTVPNGKLADSKLQNISQPDLRLRIKIPIGVAYGSDPDKVKKIILKELNKLEHAVKEDPEPWVFFIAFGDSALNFEAYFYVDNIDYKWESHQKAITGIYKALNKAKITIPFPQMDVHMKKR